MKFVPFVKGSKVSLLSGIFVFNSKFNILVQVGLLQVKYHTSNFLMFCYDCQVARLPLYNGRLQTEIIELKEKQPTFVQTPRNYIQ